MLFDMSKNQFCHKKRRKMVVDGRSGKEKGNAHFSSDSDRVIPPDPPPEKLAGPRDFSNLSQAESGKYVRSHRQHDPWRASLGNSRDCNGNPSIRQWSAVHFLSDGFPVNLPQTARFSNSTKAQRFCVHSRLLPGIILQNPQELNGK